MDNHLYKLSPSDFAYLYEDCKLCYYLKVKHGIYQPSMPMPGVFSAINTRLQGTLIGKNLRELSSHLPQGIVVKQEGWVESRQVSGTKVYIKGKYDLLIRKSDGTHMLVDLKISQPNEDKIEKYKMQLAAYKFALENPVYGQPVSISEMGLLIFYPDSVSFVDGSAVLDFPPKWLAVPQDMEGFTDFSVRIDRLLSGGMPSESPTCKWCQYRHVGDTLSHPGTDGTSDIPF